MGSIIQIAIVYVLPAAAAFFWFYWSEIPSKLVLLARLVAVLGAIGFLANMGYVAKYGVHAPHAWAAGAVLGVLAATPRFFEAPTVGEAAYFVQAGIAAAAGVVLFVVGATLASAARASDKALALTFPLKAGTYLVLGGSGGMLGIDAHGPAQRHGIDFVKIDALGFRASSLWPTSPDQYFVFDDAVVAPCDGTIVASEDDRPDLPPTQTDSAAPLGNFVAIACPDATVVLAHLKRGSITAARNTGVRTSEELARVGASGVAGEAKLRVYAVAGKESSVARLLAQASPIPITFGEGPLVRADRVSR